MKQPPITKKEKKHHMAATKSAKVRCCVVSSAPLSLSPSFALLPSRFLPPHVTCVVYHLPTQTARSLTHGFSLSLSLSSLSLSTTLSRSLSYS